MEVNGLTTYSAHHFTNHPIPVEEDIDSREPDHSVSLPRRDSGTKIDPITMDLEDMKHFLFMMLRGGNIVEESEEDKIGRFVNKFA